MKPYQQIIDPVSQEISSTILRREDNAYIPNDPANRDRYEYEQWLAQGNEPDPPDNPVIEQPPIETIPVDDSYSPEEELRLRQEQNK